MTHTINTLKLEVTCPSEEEAFALRTTLSQNLASEVSMALEEVCADRIGDDEWILIDKLEITLDRFNAATFFSEFPASLRRQLEQELSKAFASRVSKRGQGSMDISVLPLVISFLRFGTFPWWGESLGKSIDELIKELLTAEPQAFQAFLIDNRFIAPIWKRIELQLTDGRKQEIIELLPELQEVAKELIALAITAITAIIATDTKTAPANSTIPSAIQESLRSVILSLVLSEVPGIFAAVDRKAYAVNLFKQMEYRLSDVTSAASRVDTHSIIQSVLSSASGRTIELGIQLEGQASLTHALSSSDTMPNDTSPDAMAMFSKEQNAGITEEQKYIVRRSGIALLAPFLKPLFTHTGLLQESKWVSHEAQYRAVHLLYFLSTGMQYPPEQEVLLEKIFCGLPMEEPVPRIIDLTTEETAECESLLRAVVQHWSALKTTSIAGLRQAFLQRGGILMRKGSDWNLAVERKTLDVLLDQIPWGFSTIGFPWNRYLIFVQW